MLTAEEEAIAGAFRPHTLLPVEDGLYALQESIPHRARAARHRCVQRHGVSRLPLSEDGQATPEKKGTDYPLGCLHVDFAGVQPPQGRQYRPNA